MRENSSFINLTVHCLIRNEDIWLGYALKSVLPFVQKVLVFDNGPSIDKTVEVINLLNSKKILFEEKGKVYKEDLANLRQEMVDRTETEWFLILDGDEIWPQKQLTKLLHHAKNAPKNIVALVNFSRNCVGDIYHYLPESFGQYQIGPKRGNFNIRLIRKTRSLRVEGEYPFESWVDNNGPIQLQVNNLMFADCWLLHTTLLKRSSIDSIKRSGSFGKPKFWEKGIPLRSYEIPEVLQDPFTKGVTNPLKRRGNFYEIVAAITTPLLQLRRRLKRKKT